LRRIESNGKQGGAPAHKQSQGEQQRIVELDPQQAGMRPRSRSGATLPTNPDNRDDDAP